MPWTWVRPRDPDLLRARPLLDLGTGDGQTLHALTTPDGLAVGLDHSPEALRAARRTLSCPLVVGDALRAPFADGTFRLISAGDLVHHLDGPAMQALLGEARRLLRPDGRLVAWWYAEAGRPGPDAPPFPRDYVAVAEAARGAGFGPVSPLDLEMAVEGTPETIGLVAEG